MQLNTIEVIGMICIDLKSNNSAVKYNWSFRIPGFKCKIIKILLRLLGVMFKRDQAPN